MDPDLQDRIHLHAGPEPLFDKFGVEEEIQRAFQRSVYLKSGGHIVIEPTEALVSIDVNTGRFTGKGKKDPDETILRTNLEAAREIAKQLRLRDIGGIIVADFIDMESQAHRDQVLNELRTQLGKDRARTKAFRVSDLGLIEMTRQRVRPSLYQSLTSECTLCGGMGRVYTPATVVRRIERSLRRAASSKQEKQIVTFRTRDLAERNGFTVEVPPALLDILVQTFSDLRQAQGAATSDDQRLESALSTAEQIGVHIRRDGFVLLKDVFSFSSSFRGGGGWEGGKKYENHKTYPPVTQRHN